MASRGRLFLIDGSNNLYRSYYAIRSLSTSAGFSTNAMYGFTQMLRKLLREQKPDAVAVAFDVSGSTHRKEQFTDYKKDRKPMPDDLAAQIPHVFEICEAFGLPVLRIQDHEADDVLGSLACSARELNYEVFLATSDKDFFQLVRPGISLYHTTRDLIYDEQGVKEVFGLAPDQVVDVMAIWGDAIDNIPGVPGIGEKGAKSLIQEFGSLDALYANLERVKKASHRQLLAEHREQAFLSRELAQIRCDLTLEVTPDQLTLRGADRSRLHEIFSKFELQSLMKEYLPEEKPAAEHVCRLVTSAEELEMLLGASSGPVALYLEPHESNTGRAIAAAISVHETEALVVPLADELGGTAALSQVLDRLLSSERLIVAHDIKALLRTLAVSSRPIPPRFDDTMIMSYVLQPGAYSHALENLTRERLQRDLRSRKEIDKGTIHLINDPVGLGFLGEKAALTLALYRILEAELNRDSALRSIYDELELPLIKVLALMETAGIRIDIALLHEMSVRMGQQIAELETKIYAEAGEEFNINSPTQLGVILFDKLQYPILKKTQKTKSSSTGVEVLRELASYGHVVPQLILEHRELHKLKSTYVDALPQLVDQSGRVHTTFNQAVAATGRLSSSDPNLQNIPVRTEQGRLIRRAFIADQGNVLLAADYSQIELRILAHMTNDEQLIDAFRRGVDIHRSTAARIFNAAELLVTPDQRRAAKTINFGVLYGMSAFRLAQDLGISGREAKDFIDAYFARYPTIRAYLDRTLQGARETGKVTTLFGRVRHIPEIHNRSWTIRGNAERMATNAPIQGTAADLLKMAMLKLDQRLRDESQSARMLLTVHDEIVIEVPESEAENHAAIVKSVMEDIYPLAVPLAVETRWGRNWYEAKG